MLKNIIKKNKWYAKMKRIVKLPQVQLFTILLMLAVIMIIISITVTAVIAALYEKILWKYDPFLKLPVLNGKYEGEVKSNFDGSERKIVVQIKQSLFSIFVLLKTEESSSKAISAKIIDRDGENVLTYTYINRPKTEVRDRSEIHYGTAILSITDNYEILEGGYYTDRNTAGDMVLRR